jgi:hypothetical protein
MIIQFTDVMNTSTGKQTLCLDKQTITYLRSGRTTNRLAMFAIVCSCPILPTAEFKQRDFRRAVALLEQDAMGGDPDFSFYRTTPSSAPVALALYTQEVHEQNGWSTGIRRLNSCIRVVGRWEYLANSCRVGSTSDPNHIVRPDEWLRCNE